MRGMESLVCRFHLGKSLVDAKINDISTEEWSKIIVGNNITCGYIVTCSYIVTCRRCTSVARSLKLLALPHPFSQKNQ